MIRALVSMTCDVLQVEYEIREPFSDRPEE
jgi:hypothetical protein